MRSRECGTLIVATILVVVSALAALQFKRERDTVRATLTRYVAAVPIAMVRPAAGAVPQRLASLVQGVRDHITAGEYALADEQLERLVRERPSITEGPSEEAEEPSEARGGGRGRAAARMSPKAREFFNEHPRLDRRARALAGAIMGEPREGADVREARELLRRAIATAEEGDTDKVAELISRTEKALGGPPKPAAPEREARRERAGGPPPEVRALQRKFAELHKAAEEARAQGKDPRGLARLVPQIQEAMKKGDTKRVGELLQQATTRLKQAKPAPEGAGRTEPRGGPSRRPGGGRPGERAVGPQVAAARRVTQMLMATMTEEQDALNNVRRSIGNAELALREKNQDQVREILHTATVELARIEHGRRALVRLASAGPGRPPEGEARERGERLFPAHLDRPVPVPVVQPREAIVQINDCFDKVRSLTDDEYAEGKQKLAIVLLERIVLLPEEPEKKAEPEAPAGKPVTEGTLRHKLAAAEKPYREARASDGADAEKAQRLLAEARRFLYAREYRDANTRLDEALKLLGVPAPEEPGGGGASERPRREERARPKAH